MPDRDGATPQRVHTARGPVECVVTGRGPAVLALHGAMGGWDQGVMLARLTGLDAGTVIAPSRPGYPGTPLSSGAAPVAQADLCAALLDSLGVDDAVVVAISGGGPCALAFAERHRARCRALVLVSTCGGPMRVGIPLSFRLTRWLARWPRAVQWMRGRTLADVDRAASRSVRDPAARRRLLDDPVAGPLFRDLLSAPFERMAERLPGTGNDIAVTRRGGYALDRIRVPTLVVHGTEDRLLPFAEHGARLGWEIAGAECLVLEGGEHVAVFTHHAEVAARIAAFLGRLGCERSHQGDGVPAGQGRGKGDAGPAHHG